MTFPFSPEGHYKILLERRVENLFLRKAKYLPGDWSRRHHHENARFVFVLSGSFTEKYEKKERYCQPLTCIFRPPFEKHSETYHREVVCLSVDISPPWLKRLENYSVRLNRSNDFRKRSLTHLVNRVAGEMLLDDDLSSLAIDALLTEIAIEAHRSASQPKREKSRRWLDGAVEFIHENYLSKPSLDEIARDARVHPVHLARAFRKNFQCTVADYIRRLRIEAAARMLAKADLSLAQVAFESGFTDQSHFTKVFKRLTGKTPAEFRKTCGKAS